MGKLENFKSCDVELNDHTFRCRKIRHEREKNGVKNGNNNLIRDWHVSMRKYVLEYVLTASST